MRGQIDRAMSTIRERFKRIDARFVNAGIGKSVPFDQVTEEFFDETVAARARRRPDRGQGHGSESSPAMSSMNCSNRSVSASVQPGEVQCWPKP
jgi:NAD(P)-dependent dehydrogenase (short-subunit alcohol dehydrogenase family)